MLDSNQENTIKVTDELISKLATLSLLNFENEDREEIKKDLQQLIAFCDKTKKVPLDFSLPREKQQAPFVTPTRADSEVITFPKKEALKNATLKNDDFFLVPKVIDKQNE